MLKGSSLIAAVGLLAIVIVSACTPAAQPTTAPVAPPPAQPQAQPQPEGQTTAPLCQAGAASCSAPDVTDTQAIDTYCQKKIPYTNILVPDGTVWEELDKSGDFICTDQNQMEDGKRVIACTGKELIAYQLKLTNPTCGGTNLVSGTGQCQEGFGFDSAQQCCAPVDAGDAGSVTITVNIGACPLPQPQSQ